MKNSDRLEELLLTAKLRGCGGTIFWFCYRSDRERIALFHRTVQAVGRQGRDGREVCSDREAEEMAEHFIALFLARLEDWKTAEERTILIRTKEPLEPWAERLTGISYRELEQAIPLEDGLSELERVRDRFLILDQGFILPFLENFYRRCGEKFSRCFLTMDCLLEQLGIPAKQRVGKLLEALPPPPKSRPDVPPENVYLAERYQLIRALLYRLEETE